MKLSIYTRIMPRLETFFLEEWIEHNLQIGVDKIYIYDAGNKPFNDRGGHKNRTDVFNDLHRELGSSEKNIKWGKKPNVDYFLDYTEKQIQDKLYEIQNKFKKNTEITDWKYGKNHNEKENVRSQILGYKNVVTQNKSDWWMLLDPDEFLHSCEFTYIKKFLCQMEEQKKFSLKLSQRIFKNRQRNVSTRKIFQYSGDLRLTKTLVKSPIISELKLHSAESSLSPSYFVNPRKFRFNHYRGPSEQMGGPAYGKIMYKPFDKIDKGMLKYL